MGILAFAVAFVNSSKQANVVAVFIAIQLGIVTGKAGSQNFPSSLTGLGEMFNVISLFNFDLEYIQPGCNGIPSIDFITTYWSTLLFMLFSWILFMIACVLRYLIVRHQIHSSDMVEEANTQLIKLQLSQSKNQYYRRCVHATVMLLAMMYLKLTSLTFKGFLCEAQTPSIETTTSTIPTDTIYVLVYDPTVRCFSADHSGIFTLMIAVFVLFVIGFPIVCWILITRTFSSYILEHSPKTFMASFIRCFGCLGDNVADKYQAKQSMVSSPPDITPAQPPCFDEDGKPRPPKSVSELNHQRHTELYGSLFKGMQTQNYYFRMVIFPMCFVIGLITYGVLNVRLRLLLFGLVFALSCCIHMMCLPFASKSGNKLGMVLPLILSILCFIVTLLIGILVLFKWVVY